MGRLGEEVVEGEEEERGGEGEPPKEAVAGDDGTGEGRDADIEDAGGEGFVGGHQRLHPVLIGEYTFMARTGKMAKTTYVRQPARHQSTGRLQPVCASAHRRMSPSPHFGRR